MPKDWTGTSNVCYAWFIWVKGEYKCTELKWIY